MTDIISMIKVIIARNNLVINLHWLVADSEREAVFSESTLGFYT